MSGEEKKPPPFFCPKCGQKHRADLSELSGVVGAVMKTPCAGCGIDLAVTLDEDDLPVCQVLEEYAGAQPAVAPPPAPTPKKSASKKSAPSKSAPRSSKRSRKGKAPAPASRKSRGKGKDQDADTPAGAVSSPSIPAPAPVAATSKKSDAPKSTAAVVIDAEFSKGDHIGRYQIEDAVGEGGTGTVYSAFDPTTNRTVALKVLLKGQSDAMHQRFLREIEVQANIRHQNIMPVFDRGTLEDGRPYFTMELLYKPWTLTKIIEHRERGSLTRYTTLKDLNELPALIEKVLVPVCDGIYVANVENGVVHRDLKPDNVLVDSRTLRPYVIDFGICQAVETRTRLDTGPVIAPTVEDAGIVGTPRYLSPEQAKGNVNARTDVWGLGALLHCVITAEPPLAGAVPITKAELKRRIAALEEAKAQAVAEGSTSRIALCDEKLARLEDPGLRTIEAIFRDAREGNYGELPSSTPSPLVAIVQKAMAKSKSDRYVNARQLSSEIGTWLKGGSVRALAQSGGTAAAVHSARRAVKAHLVTAMWILAALAGGIFIGKALAGDAAVGSSTRVTDADSEIKALVEEVNSLDKEAPHLTAIERYRMWQFLDARADRIEARLDDEPETTLLDKVRGKLRYARERFAPSRIVIDVPAGTPIRGMDRVTGAKVKLTVGENMLTPGAYQIDVGADASIRVPVAIPLRVRGAEEDPKLEPALLTIRPPVRPEEVPSGMVLVMGGEVAPRGLPFDEPASTILVDAFLMDRSEVSNEEYATYLLTLKGDEQKARTPAIAFVPDPQTGTPTLVKGKEQLPVVGVRPEDAKAFALWRSKREAAVVRLPMEHEWVLAAGGNMGFALVGGAQGFRTDGVFSPPLKPVADQGKDEGPFGVRGMLANAREIVASSYDDTFVIKGAGVGDDPDQGAVYMRRALAADGRHATTGFRCVREIKASAGAPPK